MKRDRIFSTDYFSLIPWIFLFVTGYFAYSVIYRYEMCHYGTKTLDTIQLKKESCIRKVLKTSICAPLGWIGRNALLLYMLHQPMIYGVLLVLQTYFLL